MVNALPDNTDACFENTCQGVTIDEKMCGAGIINDNIIIV
jgi:hypothetical protein